MDEKIDQQIKTTQKSLQLAQEVGEKLNSKLLYDNVISLHQDKLRLLNHVKELKASLHQQKDDTNDVYYYLNKKCDESFESAAKLEDQIITEQVDREQAEKQYQKRIQILENDLKECERKYKDEIHFIEEKYSKANDYYNNLIENEALVAKLKQDIIDVKKSHVDEMHQVERKLILERDKMKEEYNNKLANMKQEAAILVEKNLAVRTKETIVENDALKNNLKDQSAKTDEVLELTNQILAKDKKLQLQLKLSKSMEDELLSRVEKHQKIIKELKEKLSTDLESFNTQKSELVSVINDKDNTIRLLEDQIRYLQQGISLQEQKSIKASGLSSFLLRSYENLKLKGLSRKNRDESSYSPTRSVCSTLTGSVSEAADSQSSLSILTYSPTRESETSNFQDEAILVELIDLVLKKYPKRFSYVTKRGRSRASSQQADPLLPPIIRQPTRKSSAMTDLTALSPLPNDSSSLISNISDWHSESIGSPSTCDVGCDNSISSDTVEGIASMKSMPARLYPGYASYELKSKNNSTDKKRLLEAITSRLSSSASLDGRTHTKPPRKVRNIPSDPSIPIPQYLIQNSDEYIKRQQTSHSKSRSRRREIRVQGQSIASSASHSSRDSLDHSSSARLYVLDN